MGAHDRIIKFNLYKKQNIVVTTFCDHKFFRRYKDNGWHWIIEKAILLYENYDFEDK